jgi:hypothetical protein
LISRFWLIRSQPQNRFPQTVSPNFEVDFAPLALNYSTRRPKG